MLSALQSILGNILILISNFAASSGLIVERDVPYALGEAHRLDIYRASHSGARPVIVYLYGGGWRGGSKERIAFIGAALARRGFVVVVPEYRHFPQATLPEILDDQAAAVGWTFDHTVDIGGDPRRVIIAGHSSGAWSAAMLALDPRWLEGKGVKPGQLAGMIGLAGPYMVSSLNDPVDRAVFGGTGREMEPLHQVSAPHPPMLLLTGTADKDVLPISTASLADRLHQVAGTVETKFYADLGHEDMVRSFTLPFDHDSAVTADVANFAKSIPSTSQPGD